MISPSPHSIFLKSVFYKSNLENPFAIKISTIGLHILGKQKGSELFMGPNRVISDGNWIFKVNLIKNGL